MKRKEEICQELFGFLRRPASSRPGSPICISAAQICFLHPPIVRRSFSFCRSCSTLDSSLATVVHDWTGWSADNYPLQSLIVSRGLRLTADSHFISAALSRG